MGSLEEEGEGAFACKWAEYSSWKRAFGKVYQAKHKDTGFVMAIKCVPIDGPSYKLSKHIMKELEVLKTCRSDHIVSYYGSCLRQSSIWVCISSYSTKRKPKIALR